MSLTTKICTESNGSAYWTSPLVVKGDNCVGATNRRTKKDSKLAEPIPRIGCTVHAQSSDRINSIIDDGFYDDGHVEGGVEIAAVKPTQNTLTNTPSAFYGVYEAEYEVAEKPTLSASMDRVLDRLPTKKENESGAPLQSGNAAVFGTDGNFRYEGNWDAKKGVRNNPVHIIPPTPLNGAPARTATVAPWTRKVERRQDIHLLPVGSNKKRRVAYPPTIDWTNDRPANISPANVIVIPFCDNFTMRVTPTNLLTREKMVEAFERRFTPKRRYVHPTNPRSHFSKKAKVGPPPATGKSYKVKEGEKKHNTGLPSRYNPSLDCQFCGSKQAADALYCTSTTCEKRTTSQKQVNKALRENRKSCNTRQCGLCDLQGVCCAWCTIEEFYRGTLQNLICTDVTGDRRPCPVNENCGFVKRDNIYHYPGNKAAGHPDKIFNPTQDQRLALKQVQKRLGLCECCSRPLSAAQREALFSQKPAPSQLGLARQRLTERSEYLEAARTKTIFKKGVLVKPYSEEIPRLKKEVAELEAEVTRLESKVVVTKTPPPSLDEEEERAVGSDDDWFDGASDISSEEWGQLPLPVFRKEDYHYVDSYEMKKMDTDDDIPMVDTVVRQPSLDKLICDDGAEMDRVSCVGRMTAIY